MLPTLAGRRQLRRTDVAIAASEFSLEPKTRKEDLPALVLESELSQ
jgi:hypothetical protein